jgi:hypothetical protein
MLLLIFFEIVVVAGSSAQVARTLVEQLLRGNEIIVVYFRVHGRVVERLYSRVRAGRVICVQRTEILRSQLNKGSRRLAIFHCLLLLLLQIAMLLHVAAFNFADMSNVLLDLKDLVFAPFL